MLSRTFLQPEEINRFVKAPGLLAKIFRLRKELALRDSCNIVQAYIKSD